MTTNTTTTYKGFNITTNVIDEMDRLKKTVDDYEEEMKQEPMSVDAARVDMARRSACKRLTPLSAGQAKFLARIARGFGPIAPAMAPTRIEARHFTKSSRVRGFVHGGMLGTLSVRLMDDSSQTRRRSRTHHSIFVIERANSATGCVHVRWSIPEFQRRFNMHANEHKHNQNPLFGMTVNEVIAQLNLLNTEEHRAQFQAECAAYANAPTHSRVAAHHVMESQWISDFMCAFTRVCSHKIAGVNDCSHAKIVRCVNLVDLYRFVAANLGWIFNDPLMQFIPRMNRLYIKYIDRLVHTAADGVEHSAYIMATHFPELMTPELHVRVVPVPDAYRVPEMQIADDDALFGPLKATYQGLMPAAPIVEQQILAQIRTLQMFHPEEDEDEDDHDYDSDAGYSDEDDHDYDSDAGYSVEDEDDYEEFCG
jgi:hypothetical protein